MARTKVRLAYIVNDHARKATYKKRKNGLLKKLDELQTLCGIVICAVIYSPFDEHPVVWPNPEGVYDVLRHFMNMPEMDKTKLMLDHQEYLRQKIHKLREKLRKQRVENHEKTLTRKMFECLRTGTIEQCTMNDLEGLNFIIDRYMKNLQIRMRNLKEDADALTQTQNVQDVGTSPTGADVDMVRSTGHMKSNTQQHQQMQQEFQMMHLQSAYLEQNQMNIHHHQQPPPPPPPPPMSGQSSGGYNNNNPMSFGWSSHYFN